MRTACFVDGYNLFYGLLAGTEYKWLDLPALLAHILRIENPDNVLATVSFFTSGVKPSLASRGILSKEAQDRLYWSSYPLGSSLNLMKHQNSNLYKSTGPEHLGQTHCGP